MLTSSLNEDLDYHPQVTKVGRYGIRRLRGVKVRVKFVAEYGLDCRQDNCLVNADRSSKHEGKREM
jgi:hypothetical protein